MATRAEHVKTKSNGVTVYTTSNAEYHVSDGQCVGIRPLNPHKQGQSNWALRMPLTGFFSERGFLPTTAPPDGKYSLCFSDGATVVMTSPVVAVATRGP